MPRSVASIDAQIAVLEAKLLEASGPLGVKSMADGNTSIQYQSATEIMETLNMLYGMRDRLSGDRKINVRGRVVQLPGGPTGSTNGY
jgi:hypothetical protein